MEGKNAIIICVSKHQGNTLKIANKMAEVLKCEVKGPKEISPEEILKYDIIGLGSGIYAFGMHRSLKRLIKKVKDGDGKKVFLFSTSADLDGKKYHKSMIRLLEKKNFNLIGEFNCPGSYFGLIFGKQGGVNPDRPDESDLNAAAEFARKMAF